MFDNSLPSTSGITSVPTSFNSSFIKRTVIVGNFKSEEPDSDDEDIDEEEEGEMTRKIVEEIERKKRLSPSSYVVHQSQSSSTTTTFVSPKADLANISEYRSIGRFSNISSTYKSNDVLSEVDQDTLIVELLEKFEASECAIHLNNRIFNLLVRKIQELISDGNDNEEEIVYNTPSKVTTGTQSTLSSQYYNNINTNSTNTDIRYEKGYVRSPMDVGIGIGIGIADTSTCNNNNNNNRNNNRNNDRYNDRSNQRNNITPIQQQQQREQEQDEGDGSIELYTKTSLINMLIDKLKSSETTCYLSDCLVKLLTRRYKHMLGIEGEEEKPPYTSECIHELYIEYELSQTANYMNNRMIELLTHKYKSLQIAYNYLFEEHLKVRKHPKW